MLPQPMCGYGLTALSGLIYVTFVVYLKAPPDSPSFSVDADPGSAIIYGHNKGHIYCTHVMLSEEFGSVQLNLSPLFPPRKRTQEKGSF